MASHEVHFEDLIKVDEIDDWCNADTANAEPDYSDSSLVVDGQLPSPSDILRGTPFEPDVEAEPLSHHDLIAGHALGRNVAAGSNFDFMLGLDMNEVYQDPWSIFNARQPPSDLWYGGLQFPRTTTQPFDQPFAHEFLADQPPPTTPSSTSQYPDDSLAASPDAQGPSPPSSSGDMLASPIGPLVSSFLDKAPRATPSNWLSGSAAAPPYTSAGPWLMEHRGAERDSSTIEGYRSSAVPSFLEDATVPWDDYGLKERVLVSSESASCPSGGLQGAKTCIVPSQTVHTQQAVSPTSVFTSEASLWEMHEVVLPAAAASQAGTPSEQFGTPSQTRSPDTSGPVINLPWLEDELHYQRLVQEAREKWRNIGSQDQDVRDLALVEMRNLGISYKDIKAIGNFPEALATMRGRFRNVTKPSQERVRRPNWKDVDIQLLFEAVQRQDVQRSRNRRAPRICWKDVAKYMHQNGSSYKFSYVTCSQKWQQMTTSRSAGNRSRAVRGHGAYSM